METPTPEKNSWRETFEENRPQTDEQILDGRRFSRDYKFGHKTLKEGEIHEVTDWANIKKFISEVESQARVEERELILEQAKQYMVFADYECLLKDLKNTPQ